MFTRFIFRKNARRPDLPGAVVCRVTVDKAARPFTTPVHCLRADWDAAGQRVRGRAQAVKADNAVLTDIERDLNRLYYDMERAGQYVTPERLLRAYHAGTQPGVPLLAAWSEFVSTRRALVGKAHTAATQLSNEMRGDRLREFLTARKRLDLLPEEFSAKYADAFLAWLRVERGVCQNYAAKVVQTVKQVLRWCVRQEYAQVDPLAAYSLKFAPPKPPTFLTSDELERLRRHVFGSAPLRVAADCFLFQCYTGLAFADLERFRRAEHTRLGPDGRPWLVMPRQKTQHSTGQAATVPLLPLALGLLATYGERLPVATNQVYNRYLKEIAVVVGLTMRLTSHVGRKTAGAQFLAAGVSLDAVSKVLGHSSVLQTQHCYVSITNEVVAREFARAYREDKAA